MIGDEIITSEEVSASELKEIIEKAYEIDTGLIDETGENIKITPEIEINEDEDEIILQYEVYHQAGTYTDAGNATINEVRKITEMYLLTAMKVCFELIEVFDSKYVILRVDRSSFEDAMQGLISLP